MLHPLIADPSATRHILRKFKLRAVKGLGQNFLIDAGIVRRIVDVREEFTEVLSNVAPADS